MYTLKELKPLIIEWANERDLIHSENADKQRLKLIEECGELASAILKNDIELQKDSLGDIFVVLTILEAQINKNFDTDIYRSTDSILKDLLDLMISPRENSVNSLFHICLKLNHNLTECVNLAYNKIKNRKGKTENGTFIKD